MDGRAGSATIAIGLLLATATHVVAPPRTGPVRSAAAAPASPAPASRPPPAPARPGAGTAMSRDMNMTTYDIMMPGRDMPPGLLKPRKAPR